MENKTLNKLIEQARKDPQFFHDLVFEPDKVIGKLDYLDRKSKGSLVAVNPEEIVGRLIGVAWCDVTCTSSCGATCGKSCGYTTNLQDSMASRISSVEGCDVTCTSSCGATCGKSCGYTTNLEGFESRVSQYAR